MRSFCSVFLVLLLLGAQQPEPVDGFLGMLMGAISGLSEIIPHAIRGIDHVHRLVQSSRSRRRRRYRYRGR